MRNIKKITPSFYIDNIYKLKINFFKENKIEYVFLDLDNTLDSPFQKIPTIRTINFINNLQKNNIKPVIISNNSKKRVTLYASKLDNIDIIYRAYKPFTKKLKRFLKNNKISQSSVIIIGDQLFTDIKMANKLNIKSILTKPLVNIESKVTYFNRKLDIKYRNKVLREANVKNLEDLYANY
ncbi:MAG: YqeG family HAD IIIA-type phosphatase [Bacillales bacterium]